MEQLISENESHKFEVNRLKDNKAELKKAVSLLETSEAEKVRAIEDLMNIKEDLKIQNKVCLIWGQFWEGFSTSTSAYRIYSTSAGYSNGNKIFSGNKSSNGYKNSNDNKSSNDNKKFNGNKSYTHGFGSYVIWACLDMKDIPSTHHLTQK